MTGRVVPGDEPRETTLGELLEDAVAAIGGHRAEARADAEVLLAHTTGEPRHQALVWPERGVPATARERYLALVARRARGEPVAYLTGRRAFWTFELEVTPATLIPRPETERLVELALDLSPPEPMRALDVGTGSGAIALALALERRDWEVIAGDASAAALEVAARNVARLATGRVELRHADWLGAARGERFSLVVSNPPYVAEDDPHLARGDLRFEPAAALRAGPDGLAALRAIVAGAPHALRPGGWLAVEHGHDQGPAVRALMAAQGLEAPATHRDHAGLERVTLARVRA